MADVDVAALQDAAISANEAWLAQPDDEGLKTAALEAHKTAKAAHETAKIAAAEAKKLADAEAAKNTPPATYELKQPENSTLADSALERIAADAKARGLTNAQAQEEVIRQAAAVAEYHAAQQAQLETAQAAWIEEVKADQELGGAALAKHAELGKRFVDKFGSEALKEKLKETGLGNHPEFMRLCVRAGKAMEDGALVTGGAPPTTKPATLQEALYPSKPKE